MCQILPVLETLARSKLKLDIIVHRAASSMDFLFTLDHSYIQIPWGQCKVTELNVMQANFVS